MNEKLKE